MKKILICFLVLSFSIYGRSFVDVFKHGYVEKISLNKMDNLYVLPKVYSDLGYVAVLESSVDGVKDILVSLAKDNGMITFSVENRPFHRIAVNDNYNFFRDESHKSKSYSFKNELSGGRCIYSYNYGVRKVASTTEPIINMDNRLKIQTHTVVDGVDIDHTFDIPKDVIEKIRRK